MNNKGASQTAGMPRLVAPVLFANPRRHFSRFEAHIKVTGINRLENHCTQTVQSSHVGCSRRVHRIVYIAVKKGNLFVNILLLKKISLISVTYKAICVSA